jgi:hypothetical protein
MYHLLKTGIFRGTNVSYLARSHPIQTPRGFATEDFGKNVEPLSQNVRDVTKTLLQIDVKHLEKLIEKADHHAINSVIRQYNACRKERLHTEINGWIRGTVLAGGFLTGWIVYLDVSDKLYRWSWPGRRLESGGLRPTTM